MLPSSFEIADAYWAADFGCERAALRPAAPRLQKHAGRLSSYSGMQAFVLESSPLVSVPEWLFDVLDGRASLFHTEALRDPAAVRALLAPAVVTKVIGPALLHYADRSCFRPIGLDQTRALTPQDEPAFSALKAACDADDWEPKGFALDSERTFGAFAPDGALLSVAGIRVWADCIAHLSVVSLPAARARGFGTQVVALATERALETGLLPQYRVLEDNLPSRRLADKLGFQRYGFSVAARLAPA